MKTIKAKIGETLLLLQKIEALLRASLYGVGNTKDTKLAKLLDRDHQTMGMLINGMKRQVELPEDFATTLDHLLRDRNILVHELFLQNWFDLKSESGLKQTNLFLNQIIENASVVLRIVIAFVLSIEENNSTINSLSEKKRKIYDHIINRINVTSEPDFGEKTPDEYFDAFSDQVRKKFVKKIKPKN
ncbi:MAG: hypothetical protein CL666_09995 [Balneola sp.]|nr:hypothetical protein [Balneola sp.]|tara:strand:+ start:7323 stop:7883 length:561 start_codon:yes stop_codon:yes gene_type:complete